MNAKIKTLTVILTLCLIAGVISCSGDKNREAGNETTIRFGTLPVIQALPIFVAAEKGYFKKHGLRVELIPFNSATEKDVALSSAQISGYFGDMLTPMVLRANGTPVKIVATNFNTTTARRMFAVVAAPGKANLTLGEAAGQGIGTGSNTIVEFLTAQLLKRKGLREDQVHFIEIKNIPIRLQMLLTNQVAAAALPEPLVTLAEKKGGRILADDAGQGLSPTVLVFHESFLKKHPEAVRPFLAAVNEAAADINANPEGTRPIMNRDCRIPEALRQTFFIPPFPQVSRPEVEQFGKIHEWLIQKKMINRNVTYEEMVAAGDVS